MISNARGADEVKELILKFSLWLENHLYGTFFYSKAESKRMLGTKIHGGMVDFGIFFLLDGCGFSTEDAKRLAGFEMKDFLYGFTEPVVSSHLSRYQMRKWRYFE